MPRQRAGFTGGAQSISPLSRYTLCYHDLIGDVLGRDRDEQQILDVVDDVEELDMLFAIGRADVSALVPRWWKEGQAQALYSRCVAAIEEASEE